MKNLNKLKKHVKIIRDAEVDYDANLGDGEGGQEYAWEMSFNYVLDISASLKVILEAIEEEEDK